jgi:uncharacterized membrane protein YoaK (UPF0700 family)
MTISRSRARLTAVLFAALPIAFALIRAVRTGNDLRYLWVALASLLGAAAVMIVTRAFTQSRPAAPALSTAVFLVAMLLAVFAAWLLGTTIGPGILIVAASFGFCFSAACLIYLRPTTS